MIAGEEEVAYINASDLLELTNENSKSVAVIDVRTDDFAGGKFPRLFTLFSTLHNAMLLSLIL